MPALGKTENITEARGVSLQDISPKEHTHVL